MKAVIFDLDGTLVNTIDDLAAATNQALEMHGYPAKPLADFPLMVGNGIRKLLDAALGEACTRTCSMRYARFSGDIRPKLHEPFRPVYRDGGSCPAVENRWLAADGGYQQAAGTGGKDCPTLFRG